MTMNKAAILLTLLILVPSLAAGSEDQPMPRLGEHVFVPVMAIDEPFINTHIQTTVGLGNSRNATVPVIDFNEDVIIGTAKANVVLAGIGFKYQHKVKEWLAAGLDLNVSGRVGTSTPSLISEGLTGGIGYNVGWLVRIHQSEKFILSGTARLGNGSATYVNLLDWVDGILAGEPVGLVQSRQSVRGTGGLQAAWGLSRRFGLLGSLNFSYGEPFDGQGGNSWNHDGRLALSYDMAVDLSVPLGLALTGGHFENKNGTFNDDGVWFWSARFALQSRKDFSIGLDIQTYYLTGSQSGKEYQIGQFSIDMRYYY